MYTGFVNGNGTGRENAGEGFKLKSSYAYDVLLAAILEGKLTPGEQLSETSLAKELGVSRTPLREALRMLGAEGFVQLHPNAKVTVAPFSHKDVIEILQIRRLLEGEASKLAARRDDQAKREQLRRMCARVSGICEYPAEERAEVFMEIDVSFHRIVFELAGNRHMLKVSASLNDRQARLYFARHTVDSMFDICLRQHEDILSAILEYDALRAEAYAQAHIDFIIEQVRAMP